MAVSYKKLWKLLIDHDMKKTDLRIKAGISTGALAKLGKNENVNTEILAKICKVLECGVDDVMEFIPEDMEWDMARKNIFQLVEENYDIQNEIQNKVFKEIAFKRIITITKNGFSLKMLSIIPHFFFNVC